MDKKTQKGMQIAKDLYGSVEEENDINKHQPNELSEKSHTHESPSKRKSPQEEVDDLLEENEDDDEES